MGFNWGDELRTGFFWHWDQDGVAQGSGPTLAIWNLANKELVLFVTHCVFGIALDAWNKNGQQIS